MNRVFKTKWSAAHQQYVVTDEHRATKGKASKSACPNDGRCACSLHGTRL